MGKVVLIYSLRPESPEVDLEAIKEEVKGIGHFDNLEEKDFMFGMQQIFATFILPDKVEKTGIDEIEKKLNSIKGVASVNQEAMTLV